jgi:hypothetical protein
MSPFETAVISLLLGMFVAQVINCLMLDEIYRKLPNARKVPSPPEIQP